MAEKEKLIDKIYEVDGVKCKLIDLEDLTFDEEDQINELINQFTTKDGTASATTSNEELKKIYSSILVPINEGEKINVGKIKGRARTEIIKNFFLIVMQRGISIRASMGNLPRELVEQAKSLIE